MIQDLAGLIQCFIGMAIAFAICFVALYLFHDAVFNRMINRRLDDLNSDDDDEDVHY